MRIIGRQERGKTLFYECRRARRKENDTDWEPITSLRRGRVRDEDGAQLRREAQGDAQRHGSAAFDEEEVRLHLAEFGIDEDLAMGKIKRMSGEVQQFAAAMWINHIIKLDEPTNYLDNDTLAALTKALSDFKGGVLTISHNKAFVNELCNETWLVGDGVVVAQAIAEGSALVAERRALKEGGDNADDFSLTEAKDNKRHTSAERTAAKAAAPPRANQGRVPRPEALERLSVSWQTAREMIKNAHRGTSHNLLCRKARYCVQSSLQTSRVLAICLRGPRHRARARRRPGAHREDRVGSFRAGCRRRTRLLPRSLDDMSRDAREGAGGRVHRRPVRRVRLVRCAVAGHAGVVRQRLLAGLLAGLPEWRRGGFGYRRP